MKHSTLFFSLSLLFLLTSCGGINISISQDVSATIPAGIPLSGVLFNFPIDGKAQIESQGFLIDDINSFALRPIELDAPFIHNLKFYISTPSIPKQEIVPNMDLKPYLSAGVMTISLEGSVDALPQATNIQTTVIFDVQITYGSAIAHLFR